MAQPRSERNVVLIDDLGADFGTPANPISVDIVAVPGTADRVEGKEPQGTAVAGNVDPVLVGGEATNLPPAAVLAGQLANLVTTLDRRLIVLDQALEAVAGTTTGVAVTTDADGTLQQYLRGIVKRAQDATLTLFASLRSAAGVAKVDTTANIAEGNVVLGVQAPVLGATTGAAVITDAAGTLQQYLRGLVAFLNTNMGLVAGAAVVTDANGTLQQYLRGLVKTLREDTLGALMHPTFYGGAGATATPVLVFDSSGTLIGTAGITLKASAGRVYVVSVTNAAGTVVYAMLFNKASNPVNGDTPVMTIPLGATSGYQYISIPGGRYFDTGIAIAFSTTANTLTLVLANGQKYSVGRV